MASFQSLGVAVSGLNAAQAGLYVTGHNTSNIYTTGYTRQQVLQNDFYYRTVGMNANGSMQVGLGTDVTCIRQIRDKFLDAHYRQEVKKASYHSVQAKVGTEAEQIIGETESDYSVQKILEKMWNSINELDGDPTSAATRENFISMAISFINRVDNVYERLINSQENLDLQIRKAVSRVNTLVEQINTLNGKIAEAKASTDNPNDFMDSRNEALDELSSILDINIKERADGTVDITAEGNELLVGGMVNKLGLKYTSGKYTFVEPVFTESTEILSYNEPSGSYKRLFDLNAGVSTYMGNDNGSLKGMMVARGFMPRNSFSNPSKPDDTNNTLYPGGINDPKYDTDLRQYENELFDVTYAFLPKTIKEFDKIVHDIVVMINNLLAPTKDAAGNDMPIRIESPAGSGTYIPNPNYKGPTGLDGTTQGVELFVRKHKPRFDPVTGEYIEEDPADYYTQYTLGNIALNPVFNTTQGYTNLCLSANGDIHNQDITAAMLHQWSNNFGGTPEQTVSGAYRIFVDNIGTRTRQAIAFNEEQMKLVNQVNNKRSSVKDVAMDEELTNLMKYQHAYNASARILNAIDSMIDKIVNGTGRVGR